MPVAKETVVRMLQEACEAAGETWEGVPEEYEPFIEGIAMMVPSEESLKGAIALFVAEQTAEAKPLFPPLP